MRNILTITLVMIIVNTLSAQTSLDHVMMKKREICFGLVYEHGSFDQYWEGTLLRKNETIATVNRNAIVPMFAFGVLDKLNLIVALPYVKTFSETPNGGKFAGVHGLQDLNISLKYEFLRKETALGRLVALTTLGYATPASNYLSDYRPYSLGNGTNEASLRGIVYFQSKFGLYARVAGGYIYRGQTKAERDYYYNNGSYYTAWMDVPSAYDFNPVVGASLLDNSLRLEASYYGLNSTSGDDIRRYNAPQPTNKVEFGQAGFYAQYYFKKPKGVGVLAYYNQVVSGRNVGKMSVLGGGLTYQIKL